LLKAVKVDVRKNPCHDLPDNYQQNNLLGEIMAIDAEILQTIEQRPDSLKQELLHYAKYLVENYSKSVSQESSAQQKRRSGILQGTFVLPLPDDFDEPLEVFQEYME
jgi:hypothetical protein